MRFSIIVANYNNSAFLPELVESILTQTYKDWELVIVDDCSTIDPLPYLEPYLVDARVRLIRHPVNRGAAQAFRTAAEAATGVLIGMLGADDALMPESLARMAEAHARHPEASMVNSLSYLCDESLRIQRVFDFFHRLPDGTSLIHGVCVGNFATFKREAYQKTEGYDPRFQKALDHDIFLKLEEVGSLVFINEPLYLYRSNPIGISQGSNSSRAAQFSLLARY
ncbi:MAG: glycosyltransferase, partial [Chitinophagia bacterium]|nr:glycosyltransferase [Chitinophagia bacterium]